MMTYRSAWHVSLMTVLALSTAACLSEGDSSDPADPVVAELTIQITEPNGSNVDTVDESLSLSGTVSSEVDVESVSWTNDRGGSGTASGTQNWQTAAIPLELGFNRITVAAKGVLGATSTDEITVNRESKSTGSATISWNPPTERTDGSPLTDLAGYSIHYGRMSETYDYEVKIDNPGVTTYVIDGLVPGEWFFVAAAIDAEGVESEFSNEVSHSIL